MTQDTLWSLATKWEANKQALNPNNTCPNAELSQLDSSTNPPCNLSPKIRAIPKTALMRSCLQATVTAKRVTISTKIKTHLAVNKRLGLLIALT
jgi:hypothetical protein